MQNIQNDNLKPKECSLKRCNKCKYFMHVCRDHAIFRLTNRANPFSLISINILLSLLTDPPPKKLTVYISRVKSYQCWANSNIWKQLWWSSKAVVWRWADIAELSKTITIASAEVAAPHQLPWCPCAKLIKSG